MGKTYQLQEAKAKFMDLSISLYTRYNKKKYFVSTELSFRNNIFTTFNFTERSSVQGSDFIVITLMETLTLDWN